MIRQLTSPIVNERGERLRAVHEDLIMAGGALVSIVLAFHDRGVVLVRNARRSIWELPGGYIDSGESASDCALRELREESGLDGSGVTLLGVLEIERPAPDSDLIRCSLFQCHAAGIPAACGEETTDVAFWRPDVEFNSVSAIDEALLRGGVGEIAVNFSSPRVSALRLVAKPGS